MINWVRMFCDNALLSRLGQHECLCHISEMVVGGKGRGELLVLPTSCLIYRKGLVHIIHCIAKQLMLRHITQLEFSSIWCYVTRRNTRCKTSFINEHLCHCYIPLVTSLLIHSSPPPLLVSFCCLFRAPQSSREYSYVTSPASCKTS